MKHLTLVLASAFAGSLVASAPAFADLKEDYMAACMKASNSNTELCTCKTTEAPKYADDEMLGYIIQNFNDPANFTTMINEGKVPKAVLDKWPTYVMKSNLACTPEGSN